MQLIYPLYRFVIHLNNNLHMKPLHKDILNSSQMLKKGELFLVNLGKALTIIWQAYS